MKLSECSAEFQDRLQELLEMSCAETPEVQRAFLDAYVTEDYFAMRDVAHVAASGAFTRAALAFARYF